MERRKQIIFHQKTAITAATSIVCLHFCVAREPSTDRPKGTYCMNERFRISESISIPGTYDSQTFEGFKYEWNGLINAHPLRTEHKFVSVLEQFLHVREKQIRTNSRLLYDTSVFVIHGNAKTRISPCPTSPSTPY
jgi:hypothetical protein